MREITYYRGVPGRKYGIWNSVAKKFQFGICEDTPMLAVARLHQKLGHDAKKWRFEPRLLPDTSIESSAETCVCCGEIIPEGRQICAKCDRGE